jgi:hypothetical protein
MIDRGFLEKRLDEARAAATLVASRITRRELLKAGAVTGMATTVPWNNPESDLRIDQAGTRLSISLRDRSFALDGNWFADRARIGFRKQKGGYRLWLRNARFPGLKLYSDFNADLLKIGSRWRFRGSFLPLSLDFDVDFGAWLAGQDTIVGTVPTRSGALASNSGRIDFGADNYVATFVPAFGFEFTARHGAISLVTQNGGIKSNSILVRPLLIDETSALDAFRSERRRASTRIDFGSPRYVSFDCLLGKNDSGEPFRLTLSSAARGFLDLVDDAREQATYLLVEGEASLFSDNVAGAERAALRFDHLIYVSRYSGDLRAGFAGDVADKPHLIASGSSAAIVSRTIAGHPAFAEIRAGSIEGFDACARLHEYLTPIPDADRARFVFRDQAVRLLIQSSQQDEVPVAQENSHGSAEVVPVIPVAQLPHSFRAQLPHPSSPPQLSPRPQTAAVLGVDSRGFALLSLDCASLRLLRANDILDLRFEFSGFDYFANGEERKFVTHSDNTHAPHSKPRLIVHFPPQHVAERAYFRQLDTTGITGAATVRPDVDISGQDRETLNADERPGHGPASDKFARTFQEVNKKPYDPAKATEDEKQKTWTRLAVAAKSDRDPDFRAFDDKYWEVSKKTKHYDPITSSQAEVEQVYAELRRDQQKAGDPEAFEELTEARLSGRSRLVFEPSKNGSTSIPLTVAGLTDWRKLDLVVSARALPPNATIEDQLKLIGISQHATIGEKLFKVATSLLPPAPWETALEIPYRLLLSPTSGARWLPVLTHPDPDRPHAPWTLWHTRLDPEKGGDTVRALWSPDLERGIFAGADHPKHSTDAPWPDPSTPNKRATLRLSLDIRDRHELVLITSAYGMPALLPMPIVGAKGDLDSTDHPKSSVFPLPPGFIPLQDRDPNPTKIEGVFVPRPLEQADILMTSLGASMKLFGRWEPPASYNDDKYSNGLWPALTLERWRHNTTLGRDVFVEVLYKGFLMPIGHRASLVKVTERRFYARRDCGEPTAYLIQRMFIIIGRPEKIFPAVDQAFDGRGFPVEKLRILTTRTPDIKDPYAQDPTQDRPDDPIEAQIAWKNGGIDLTALMPDPTSPDRPKGAAFWPRVQSRLGAEVMFAFSIDGSDVPAVAPLLFVDNTAVHDATAVALLVRYYNDVLAALENRARSLGNLVQANQIAALRTLVAGDVKRSYGRRAPALPPPPDQSVKTLAANQEPAPSYSDGEARETAYVSHRWRLKAHGRLSSDNGLGEHFDVDGILEGADQPPFYPFVDEADVTIQSLEHLLGRGRGDCTVGFDTTYLQKGFDRSTNPSEIYLRVLRPSIYLDASTSGQAVGGIAKPNMRVAALSRLRGLVGGTAVTALPSPAAPARARSESSAGAHFVGEVPNLSATTSFPIANGETITIADSAGSGNPPAMITSRGRVTVQQILEVINNANKAAKLKVRAGFTGDQRLELNATGNNEIVINGTVTASGLGQFGLIPGRVSASAPQNARVVGTIKDLKLSTSVSVPSGTSITVGDGANVAKITSSTGTLSVQQLLDGVNKNTPKLKIKAFLTAEGRVELDARDVNPIIIDGTASADELAKFGLVAGRSSGLAQQTSPLLNPGHDPGDTRMASAGIFSGGESFGDALSGSSLLGLLRLMNLIKVTDFAKAPKLEEKTQYASSKDTSEKNEQTADQLKNVCGNAVERLDKLVGQATSNFQQAFCGSMPGCTGPNFESLYPDLASALDQLRAAIATALSVAEETPLDGQRVVQAASTLVISSQHVLAAAQQIKQDPVPSNLRSLLAQLADIVSNIASLATDTFRSIEDIISAGLIGAASDFQSTLRQLFCGQASSFSSLVLGRALTNAECDALASFDVTKLKAATDALLAETVTRPIHEAITAIQTLADTKIEELQSRLVDAALKTIEAVLPIAEVAAVSNALQQGVTDLTGKAREVLEIVARFVDQVVPAPTKLIVKVQTLEARIKAFDKPTGLPQNVSAEIEATRARLVQALERLSKALIDLQTKRAILCGRDPNDPAESQKNQPFNVVLTSLNDLPNKLNLVQDVVSLRVLAVGQITDLCERGLEAFNMFVATGLPQQSGLRAFSATPPVSIADVLLDLFDAAKDMLRDVVSISTIVGADSSWSALKTDAAKLGNLFSSYGKRLSAQISTLENQAKTISDRLDSTTSDLRQRYSDYSSTPQDQQKLDALRSAAENFRRAIVQTLPYGAQIERSLVGILAFGVNLEASVNKAVNDLVTAIARPITKAIVNVYGAIQGSVATALDFVKRLQALASLPPDDPLRWLGQSLRMDRINRLRAALDNFGIELNALKSLAAALQTSPVALSTVVDAANAVADPWRKGKAAPLEVIDILSDVVTNLARGNLSAIFDFDQLKDLIEQIALSFLPTKVHLDYDWGTSLEPFPSSDPVFAIIRADHGSIRVNDYNTKQDLELKVSAQVDLITGKKSYTVNGFMKPFRVDLLNRDGDDEGALGNLLSIFFSSASFGASDGSGSNFHVSVKDVQIGTDLEFVRRLQEIMSGDDGLKIVPTIPPGISISFSWAPQPLPIGTMLLFDLSFGVGCELPFDARSALFFFNISERAKPMKLYIAPWYGGAAFVTILADAHSIVGLDAAFEFGALVPIEFGPLQGDGRVMAGIYISKSPAGGVIAGFVEAVGEGNIGCFGIAFSLVVSVRQEGSTVTGSAVFTFTFKLGVADISYSVEAAYTYQGGAGGAQAKALQAPVVPARAVAPRAVKSVIHNNAARRNANPVLMNKYFKQFALEA